MPVRMLQSKYRTLECDSHSDAIAGTQQHVEIVSGGACDVFLPADLRLGCKAAVRSM